MKKITRTIEFTEGVAIFANTTTMEMYEKDFTLPGEFESESKLLSAINEEAEKNEIAIKIKSSGRVERKYVISLDDFVKYATEITD